MTTDRLIFMIMAILILCSLWIPAIVALFLFDKQKRIPVEHVKLSYERQKKIDQLRDKLNEYYDMIEEDPDSENQEIEDKIMSSIDIIENDYGITKDNVSLGDDLIRIIDNLITFYATEYTAKSRLLNEKIEIVHVDKIVKYVADSTMNSLSKEFFLASTPYTEDFFISYIAKKSKLYVLTMVVSYNAGVALM